MSQTQTSDLNTETATAAQPEQTQNTTQANVDQTTTKTYTQEDVDNIMAKVKHTTEARVFKKYADVDVDRYRQLVEAEESKAQEEATKRGEFDKVMKETAEKYNAKIQQYQNELTAIKVDGALLQAASKAKAINPDQVVQLLKGQLKLNETGTVDVIDNTTGQVRYNDKGDPLEVDTLVTEFLQSNPHFAPAGPTGSGANAAVGNVAPVEELDVSKLDMNKPADRERYKNWRKSAYGR